LRSFQQRLTDFTARGIRVVAISVDPPDTRYPHARRLGLTYTLLSDPGAEVIRHYDLLHSGGGPEHTDIARPAEFLLDPTGTVRWANLTESVTVRARPEQVLEAFDQFNAAAH
jgi:peroxiredoxin